MDFVLRTVRHVTLKLEAPDCFIPGVQCGGAGFLFAAVAATFAVKRWQWWRIVAAMLRSYEMRRNGSKRVGAEAFKISGTVPYRWCRRVGMARSPESA